MTQLTHRILPNVKSIIIVCILFLCASQDIHSSSIPGFSSITLYIHPGQLTYGLFVSNSAPLYRLSVETNGEQKILSGILSVGYRYGTYTYKNREIDVKGVSIHGGVRRYLRNPQNGLYGQICGVYHFTDQSLIDIEDNQKLDVDFGIIGALAYLGYTIDIMPVIISINAGAGPALASGDANYFPWFKYGGHGVILDTDINLAIGIRF